MQSLIVHRREVHGVEIVIVEKKFSGEAEFSQWKSQYEKRSKSSFSLKSSAKTSNSSQELKYYYCNRSGTYDPKGKGKRQIKVQGSSKMGFYCTSYIKTRLSLETGEVEAEICETHQGHEAELGHLKIAEETRRDIAYMLSKGLSEKSILDKIRDNFTEGINRDHLITTMDIKNISRKYNISGIQRHTNDQTSVALLVEELRSLDYNPIVIFKIQGIEQSIELDNFGINDFALGLQTQFQCDIMKQFGPKVICMDSTFGTTSHDFNLITVLTVDDFGEGIPVAWLLSNKEDSTTIIQFLEALKKKTGPIETNCFMSDDADQFFNAWVGVFGKNSTSKLLCSWHVDRAWRKALQEHIRNPAERVEVYHHLRVLLGEANEAHFRQRLQQITSFLMEEGHDRFLGYLDRYYLLRVQQWAPCYRIGKEVNTNMFVEGFHRLLKIVYLDSKQNRRVDHLIHILLKIARDKIFERLLKTEKGKNTHRICEVRKRHEAASKMLEKGIKAEKESDSSWHVSAEKDAGKQYMVNVLQNETCECKVVCDVCNICPHQYTCTCIDASIHHTICKHAHLVFMAMESVQPSLTLPGPTQSGNISYFNKLLEVEKRQKPNLKEMVVAQLKNLTQRVENNDNDDVLKRLHEHLKTAESTFEIQSSIGGFNPPTLGNRLAPNARITNQPRFASTRKRSSLPSTALLHPSEEQREEIVKKLLKQNIHTCAKCHNAECVQSNSREVMWVYCEICQCWYHQDCVQFVPGNDMFVCDRCQ